MQNKEYPFKKPKKESYKLWLKTILLLVSFVFFSPFFGQSTFYGPKPPPRFNGSKESNLIRVQVEIYDDPSLGGVRIQEVSFNNQDIPLQSVTLNGFRGEGGFQVSPGSYPLVWTVVRDRFAWPRTIRHKETIKIGKRDEWLQITIRGEEVTTY